MSCILVVYAPSYYFPLSSQIPGLECSKARSPFPPLFPLTFAERAPQPPRRRLVSIRVIVIVENLLVVDPFRTGIIIRAVVDLLIVRVGM